MLFCSVAVLSGMLVTGARARKEAPLSDNLESFRAFSIDASYLKEAVGGKGRQYRILATNFLYHGGILDKKAKQCGEWSWYFLLLPEDVRDSYQKAFFTVLSDGRYFPVAEDVEGGATVSYEDSWGGARSYGGKRRHEGTDLMPSVEERGYFPVVSVSDGVVEKKGWLNLGGYRIGIRAPHGAYYYYAHLDHYAGEIDEGTEVKAGEVIGYMGDSGYGEEGTVGKFAVHLHFGIYLTLDGKEVSINPYSVLRSLEGHKVQMGDVEIM